jgi:hypothetical protein
MPKFMDVHEGFVGVTAAQFSAAHARDLAIQAEEGVSFDRAWLDPTSGTAFCLATSPDIEAIKRVHARAGHPTAQVYPIAFEV